MSGRLGARTFRTVRDKLMVGAAAKADNFIGACVPDQEYGSGVTAIVCLVATRMNEGSTPLERLFRIRHRAAPA